LNWQHGAADYVDIRSVYAHIRVAGDWFDFLQSAFEHNVFNRLDGAGNATRCPQPDLMPLPHSALARSGTTYKAFTNITNLTKAFVFGACAGRDCSFIVNRIALGSVRMYGSGGVEKAFQ